MTFQMRNKEVLESVLYEGIGESFDTIWNSEIVLVQVLKILKTKGGRKGVERVTVGYSVNRGSGGEALGKKAFLDLKNV